MKDTDAFTSAAFLTAVINRQRYRELNMPNEARIFDLKVMDLERAFLSINIKPENVLREQLGLLQRALNSASPTSPTPTDTKQP